jgi:hypothetical protein
MPERNPNQDALIGRDVGAQTQDESDLNAPVEWPGLPAFHPAPERNPQLILSFRSKAARDEFVREQGLIITKKTKKTWYAWWPPGEQEDLAALRFDFDDLAPPD